MEAIFWAEEKLSFEYRNSIRNSGGRPHVQGCQYGQGKSMEWHFQHGMSTFAISFQHGGYMAWRRVEINFQRTVNMACVQKRSGV